MYARLFILYFIIVFALLTLYFPFDVTKYISPLWEQL